MQTAEEAFSEGGTRMMSKLVHLVTDNLALKALALILAVALWMIVVNVDDPKISRNFTTTVTRENESYLTDMGKYYEIDESENQVTFTVSGKRSYLEKMNGSDFKATANFENIENFEKIPVDIVAQRYSNYVSISSKTKYIDVSVENLISQPFVVTVNTSGEVADGKALGNTSVSPSILRVSGPESVVSTIAKAVVEVSVDGMTGDMSDSVVPTLYTESDGIVDSSELTFNVQSILVGIGVLDTKEVPIQIINNTSVGDDYIYTGLSVRPETVTLKGEASALKKIDSLMVVSSADLSEVTKDFTDVIDVSEQLPANVELMYAEDAEVAVTYNVEEKSTLEIEIPVKDIAITGLPISRQIEFPEDSVTLTVRGLASNIKSMDLDSISGALDVDGFSLGTHNVKISWTLDTDKYEVVEKEIQIKISQKK